ncbi:uncharacterized protein LOC111397810 [Olea europaea var. sylvestris]|uniref:uncharacterized protein LOC111397810 n=1 Tax=Olea europaea var. sylvestris TaxID=158386 RepID=UPI000C1CDEF0|nr:uncharacterized protein LOC111397810 [Olea europaea var. sylvestris]
MYAASSLKSGNVLQTHICKLNQSPWDVMSFSPSSYPPPPPPPPSFKVNGTDNLAGNGSLGEPNAAFHSAASLKIAAENELTGEIKAVKWDNSNGEGDGGNLRSSAHEDSEEGPENPGLKKEMQIVYCVKTDGKAWKCKREAAEGNSLCKHHLSQVRNCNLSLPAAKKQDKVVADSPLKPLGEKAASTSNSNEFYYYSGFGPRWGKKRGENNRVSSSTLVEQECETISSTFSEIDKEKFEIEYEEDKEGDESRRKRARKPIK